MAFSHIQGTSGATPDLYGSFGTVLLNGVTVGDTLVCSFSMICDGQNWALPILRDNRGNIWVLASSSPPVRSSTTASFGVYTYIATNVTGGDTYVTIDFSFTYPGYQFDDWSCICVDEYRGVASVRAVDKATFASTPVASGLSIIDSGPITIPANEMLYVVAFSSDFPNGTHATFSASPGFTERQYADGINLSLKAGSMATFDNLTPGAGTFNVEIGVAPQPVTLHVIMISLLATPIPISDSNPVVQIGFNANGGTFVPSPTVQYPFPNAAGNLLVAIGRVNEKARYSVSDSAGNSWNVVFDGSGGFTHMVFAYAYNSIPGPNIVTFTAAVGGSSTSEAFLVMEYQILQPQYTASSFNSETNQDSINTGNVAVVTNQSVLLITGMENALQFVGSDGITCSGPVISVPGTVRLQVCMTGFIQSNQSGIVLADFIVDTPGEYSNTYTTTASIFELNAAILGFTFTPSIGPPPPPPPPPGGSGPNRTLVYDPRTKGWCIDAYQFGVALHAEIDGAGADDSGPYPGVYTGGLTGDIRKLQSAPGAEVNSTSIVLTNCYNAGEDRADKQFGDIFLVAIIPNGKVVAAQIAGDLFTNTGNAIYALNSLGAGRQSYILDLAQSFLGTNVELTDIEVVLNWALGSNVELFLWQPSLLEMPETAQLRPTDWDEDGDPGEKFVQGFRIIADTFSQVKSISAQDDTGGFHIPNEVFQFVGETGKSFSFSPPFVTHQMRLFPQDAVPWRYWQLKWIWVPYPPLVYNWQTEMLSLGMKGWGHIPEMNVTQISTADLTLTLNFDYWPPIVVTIPNSGGVQKKEWFKIPPNKFKLVSFGITSAAPFRLFVNDMEVKLGQWDRTGPYEIIKPFGALTQASALV